MKIDVIGYPIYYGCDVKGVEKAYDYLKENGALDLLQANCEVSDLGKILVDEVKKEDKYHGHKKLKFLEPIAESSKRLASQVNESLVKGNFPLVIGGDHSMAIGSISGVSSVYGAEDISIIWIDAHIDINDEHSSPTGNIHGMPLRVLLGYGDKRLSEIGGFAPKIKSENIYYIGTRSFENEEMSFVKEKGISCYYDCDIKARGMSNIIAEVLSKINTKYIHLSFDVDVINQDIFMATGVTQIPHALVEGGIDLNEAKEVIDTILKDRRLKSMDFTEFNPDLDVDDKSLLVCKELFSVIGENF